jgi:hypothetical protein
VTVTTVIATIAHIATACISAWTSKAGPPQDCQRIAAGRRVPAVSR